MDSFINYFGSDAIGVIFQLVWLGFLIIAYIGERLYGWKANWAMIIIAVVIGVYIQFGQLGTLLLEYAIYYFMGGVEKHTAEKAELKELLMEKIAQRKLDRER